MNRVQTVTQKHYRVKKTRSKSKPGARAPKLAQLAPRCAQAWSYRGRAWPCRGQGPRPYRSSRLPCRSASRAPLCAVSRAPCPAPQRRVVRVVGLHGRFAVYRLPCRRPTPHCIAIQCPASSPLPQSQYTCLYRDLP